MCPPPASSEIDTVGAVCVGSTFDWCPVRYRESIMYIEHLQPVFSSYWGRPHVCITWIHYTCEISLLTEVCLSIFTILNIYIYILDWCIKPLMLSPPFFYCQQLLAISFNLDHCPVPFPHACHPGTTQMFLCMCLSWVYYNLLLVTAAVINTKKSNIRISLNVGTYAIGINECYFKIWSYVCLWLQKFEIIISVL